MLEQSPVLLQNCLLTLNDQKLWSYFQGGGVKICDTLWQGGGGSKHATNIAWQTLWTAPNIQKQMRTETWVHAIAPLPQGSNTITSKVASWSYLWPFLRFHHSRDQHNHSASLILKILIPRYTPAKAAKAQLLTVGQVSTSPDHRFWYVNIVR